MRTWRVCLFSTLSAVFCLKKVAAVAIVLSSVCFQAVCALEVTDVKARQRWPWNNLVDIDFKVVADGSELTSVFNIDVTGEYENGSKTLIASKFIGDPLAVPGENRITWDLGADYPGIKANDLSLTVMVSEFNPEQPVYMVVDVSDGPDCDRFPVRYTTSEPDIDDDACRTSEIWLRRVPEGTFPMGKDESSTTERRHMVTLTKPYYIGVFTVTQQQWYHVYGNWPSFYTNDIGRATRPIENVNWVEIRGSNKGVGWPSNSEVDDNTFMSILREKTGLHSFDLPTEAQWERACRAGTTTPIYTGETFNKENVSKLGRYDDNGGKVGGAGSDDPTRDLTPEFGTAKVGSYIPNAWGLYDMYGNVWERTLDIYQEDFGTDPLVDPKGPELDGSNANDRTARGGACTFGYGSMLSYTRRYLPITNKASVFGFRIVYTLPQ